MKCPILIYAVGGEKAFKPFSNYFPAIELLTVRRLRPLARRRAKTLRPSAVDILSRKPCLLTLFLLDG